MRSVMQHQFSQVPQANIPRSTFSRSHGYKTTFDAGKLIPFLVDEVLPGDTFAVHSTLFARLATPFVPVMDNLFLDTFYFFVPNRLVWSHFVNFMGEEGTPGDYVNGIVSYLTPIVNAPAGGFAEGTLADYFGIPTKVANLQANSLPFRAYCLIWNEWFRDENLQTKATVNVSSDGPDDTYNATQPFARNKRHDYFTSALPWPQKGPGVQIPLGTSAPVTGTIAGSASLAPTFKWTTTGAAAGMGPASTAAGANIVTGAAGSGGVNTSALWGSPNLTFTGGVADLSTATAATINSLRQAFQIQRLYERDARGGSRYTELVRSHFGVISPDARLQRPEYLGGGRTRINVSAVAQTSASNLTGGSTAMGDLAAIGTTAGQSGFTKSFTEHGIIIGLMEATADLTYQQGLNRMWSRRTRFDYYWPVLANLGEQAVLNQEIYAQGNASDSQAFGYQERWAEYRYFPSMVTGQMRSNHATPLDVWHLSQKFTALPTLNSTFITDAPPVKRISAVPARPDFILDAYIDCRATRPMPVYSVPGMIDHF